MKAMEVNPAKQGAVLIPVEMPRPEPGPDEIVVHVRAAGVTHVEPNQKQLIEVAKQLDDGRLKTFVKGTGQEQERTRETCRHNP